MDHGKKMGQSKGEEWIQWKVHEIWLSEMSFCDGPGTVDGKNRALLIAVRKNNLYNIPFRTPWVVKDFSINHMLDLKSEGFGMHLRKGLCFLQMLCSMPPLPPRRIIIRSSVFAGALGRFPASKLTNIELFHPRGAAISNVSLWWTRLVQTHPPAGSKHLSLAVGANLWK